MDSINVFEPSANQVLVYDEISESFVNRDIAEVLPPAQPASALSMGDEGISIYSGTVDNVLNFRKIKAGNQITLRNMHNYVEIGFAGDAYTFRGKAPEDFLLPENNLSELNPSEVRRVLSVYSRSESHDAFMETNASNVPDRDDTYDIGSNGRRYADVYAVNFHGTATRSLLAERLHRLDAKDGDVLAWSDEFNTWKPKAQKSLSLTDLDRVTKNDPRHGDILQYNSDNGQWELVEYVPYEAANDGSIVALNSMGNGVSLIRSRIGDIVELRSLRPSGNIVIEPTAGNNEIAIRAIVPETTDDLPEGTNNLYFNDERVTSAISKTKLNIHSDVIDTTPQNGQGLIYQNGVWINKDVPFELYTTDDLEEGTTNLFFSEDRVVNVLNEQLSSGLISMGDLADTNLSGVSGTYLYFNGMNFVNRKINSGDITEGSNLFFTEARVTDAVRGSIKINDVSDVTTTSPSNGQVLMYGSGQWRNQTIDFSFPTFNNYKTKAKTSTSDINVSHANVHNVDGTVDHTLNIVGTTTSTEAITVVVCIEGYGGNITWTNSIRWNNGSEPTRGPNWTNIILFWNGLHWFGMLSSRG